MNTAKRWGGRAIAIVLAVMVGSFLAVAPWSGAAPASAATAFSQCNGIDDTPGLEVRCTAHVTNRVDLGTGVTSSTIVATVCQGPAGKTPNGACTTRTTNSAQLVTSVTQCNAAGNGGGGNIFCIVTIANVVVGAPHELGVTVDQCVGSGAGGGATPLACNPVQRTTNATVAQCNGSVNGGGADRRVACTVAGATTAIGVRINQCNASVNGGGSTAHCSVSFTNKVTARPSGGSGGTGGGTSGGSGGTGGGTSGGGPGTGTGGGTSGGGPGTGTAGGSPSSPASDRAAGTGQLRTVLGFTGTDITGLLEAGLVTLLAGGGLLFLARRRAGARSSM